MQTQQLLVLVILQFIVKDTVLDKDVGYGPVPTSELAFWRTAFLSWKKYL